MVGEKIQEGNTLTNFRSRKNGTHYPISKRKSTNTFQSKIVHLTPKTNNNQQAKNIAEENWNEIQKIEENHSGNWSEGKNLFLTFDERNVLKKIINSSKKIIEYQDKKYSQDMEKTIIILEDQLRNNERTDAIVLDNLKAYLHRIYNAKTSCIKD